MEEGKMPKKILIVEDDVHMQKLLDYNFKKAGYQTSAAANGQQAIKIVKEKKPNLIIADIVMPKMDGYEMCQRLREDFDTKYIPIILLTSKAQMPDKIKGWELCIDDYITKPFHLDELMARVHSLLVRMDALAQEAYIDELTKLYNRRYFLSSLEQEINRAKRYNLTFSIVMLDLDHFKSVNDKEGHEVGDLLLRKFAQFLKNSFRKVDKIARFGGEEFVILMPKISLELTKKRIKKIRDTLQEKTFTIHSSDSKIIPLKIEACFGISSFPGDGETKEKLIFRADHAMYQVKKMGGNDVCAFADTKLSNGEKYPA